MLPLKFLPYQTHCRYLHHLCGCDSIFIQLLCRFGVFVHGTQTSDNVLVKTCSRIYHGYTAAAVNRRILCRYINNEVIPKNIKHVIWSYNTGTEDIVDICMSELFIELCDMRHGRSFCGLDSHHVSSHRS